MIQWFIQRIWDPVSAFFSSIKILILIISTVAIAGGSFYGGFILEKGRWDAQKLKDAEAVAAAQADYDKKVSAQQAEADRQAQEFATKLQDEYAQNQNLDRRLSDEIHKNSIYHSCVIPPGGVRLYEAARAGSLPVSKTAR